MTDVLIERKGGGIDGRFSSGEGLVLFSSTRRGTGEQASLNIENIQTSAFGVPIEGLSLRLKLAPLSPPATSEPGALTIKSANLGDINISLELAIEADGNSVSFTNVTLQANQSVLTSEKLRLDLDQRNLSGRIDIDGLDLETLSRQIAIDGLDVTGWLGGHLDIEAGDDGVIEIKDGMLSAATPGVIRYSAGGASALAGGDPNLTLARQALENFRFRRLQASLKGRSDSAIQVQIALAGANPDLLGGYPLEFNLNLDGALGVLAAQAASAYNLPDKLSQKLLDFLDP